MKWKPPPKRLYITKSGGKYTPDDIALRFAISLRLYDSADALRKVARNLVDKVCFEHQPNMKRLWRESSDEKVFTAVLNIVSRVCDMLGCGEPGPFERGAEARGKAYTKPIAKRRT